MFCARSPIEREGTWPWPGWPTGHPKGSGLMRQRPRRSIFEGAGRPNSPRPLQRILTKSDVLIGSAYSKNWPNKRIWRLNGILRRTIDLGVFCGKKASWQMNDLSRLQLVVARYYETSRHGYPLDRALTESGYQKAFAQEHLETRYLFAVRTFQDGVPADDAIQLLRKVASMGFEQAGPVLAAHQPGGFGVTPCLLPPTSSSPCPRA